MKTSYKVILVVILLSALTIGMLIAMPKWAFWRTAPIIPEVQLRIEDREELKIRMGNDTLYPPSKLDVEDYVLYYFYMNIDKVEQGAYDPYWDYMYCISRAQASKQIDFYISRGEERHFIRINEEKDYPYEIELEHGEKMYFELIVINDNVRAVVSYTNNEAECSFNFNGFHYLIGYRDYPNEISAETLEDSEPINFVKSLFLEYNQRHNNEII